MTHSESRKPISVTVLGLGAIGLKVARTIDQGKLPGMVLAAVCASDTARAAERVADFATRPAILSLDEAAMVGDVVVECLPPNLFRQAAGPVIASGRQLLAASVGALLTCSDLIDLAREKGGQILLPSGALTGLDAVRAAAEGEIVSVSLTTEKPVSGFQQSEYLTDKGIDLSCVTAPVCLYEGPATEGIRHFPKNVNVVAALSLAGIGSERTTLSLWADPSLTRNRHTVRLESDAAVMTAGIENLPDPGNPRTSMLTALSVISTLRSLTAPIRF